MFRKNVCPSEKTIWVFYKGDSKSWTSYIDLDMYHDKSNINRSSQWAAGFFNSKETLEH